MPTVFGTFVIVQAIQIDDEDEPGELSRLSPKKGARDYTTLLLNPMR